MTPTLQKLNLKTGLILVCVAFQFLFGAGYLFKEINFLWRRPNLTLYGLCQSPVQVCHASTLYHPPRTIHLWQSTMRHPDYSVQLHCALHHALLVRVKIRSLK